jgi:hypothetical protein
MAKATTEDRLRRFGAPIKDIKAGKAFIDWLAENELTFHFEDDPGEIVNGRNGQVFSADEVPLVRARIAELYGFDWGDLECPIGYCLKAEGHDWYPGIEDGQ